MSDPLLLDPDEFLADCFRLGRRIWEDGYRPDFLVALWRGGAPPGLVIHEYFRWRGHDPYHTAISTSRPSPEAPLAVQGLEHVIDVVNAEDRMLIVDDLLETGQTIHEVIAHLRRRARRNTPEIRVATLYHWTGHCRHELGHHYRLHETQTKPVFPHRFGTVDAAMLARADPELHGLLYERVDDVAAGEVAGR